VEGSDGRSVGREAARPGPLLGVLAILALVTLLNNVVARGAYLLWGCLAIAALALLARADGLRRQDWGLGRLTARAAWAAAGFAAATAAAMLVGTQLPGFASAYLDERVAGISAGEVAFAALVRVPVGTALLEEVAFRGVLLAMLARRYGTGWGVAGSSVAFGIWHLLPSLALVGNEAIGSAAGAHPVAASVVAMTAAGLAGAFLCLLRIRYDHLVVPVAMHATANSLAYLLAWVMMRP
jgi:CAAX protease family protein